MITDYHINLFADSVLTSHRYNNIYPIEDMRFVKDNRPLRPREDFTGIPDRFYYGLRLSEQPMNLAEIHWHIAKLRALEVGSPDLEGPLSAKPAREGPEVSVLSDLRVGAFDQAHAGWLATRTTSPKDGNAHPAG
jgi:hypothetical protein